ncbi:HAD family hydrolase [Pendulispora albinea]|uniref:HAD family hydrolase n=1 Tax=Pendulispora albinea TaxID=2741071 RepID=A0ABZ2LZI6_9BACT
MLLAFDADDTLWHHETLFATAGEGFRAILRAYHDDAFIDERLHATELENLKHFGYGIKGFVLSMIETAIALTEQRISGAEVQRIIDLGRVMLSAPIEPLPGVAEALTRLSARHQLVVVTKGDLFDQETKLARSGLGHHFVGMEVVSQKDEATYRRLLERRGASPDAFVMVGNSLKSDVLPVVAIGGRAVHIPYALTWEHERVHGVSPESHGYIEVATLAEAVPLIESWATITSTT